MLWVPVTYEHYSSTYFSFYGCFYNIFFCLLFCSAYNDASNRSAHEKKKHGGLFQAGACTEIKEDCES